MFNTHDLLQNIDIHIDFYFGIRISVQCKYYDCKIILKIFKLSLLVKISSCIIFIFIEVQINIAHKIFEVIQFDSLFLTRLRLLYGHLWGLVPK